MFNFISKIEEISNKSKFHKTSLFKVTVKDKNNKKIKLVLTETEYNKAGERGLLY